MNDSSTFRTFCHISEYAALGYANLHRMIACSEPLYLWAPSTQLLKDKNCRISESTFLDLVDEGRVRIVAREWWYSDRSRRDSHAWEGARWNPLVDAGIAAFAAQDARAPIAERRVVIAADETGETDAENLLAQNPELVDQLHEVLVSPQAGRHIPQGVIETVARYGHDRQTLATRVLRDAYNHGDALQITAPRAPFMLGDKEGAFFAILDRILRGKSVSQAQVTQTGLPPVAAQALPPEELSQLTNDVLRLLEGLERGRSASYSGFLKGEGHSDLVQWIDQLCIAAASRVDGYRAGGAFRELRAGVERVSVHDSVHDVFGNADTLITGAGLVSTGAEIATGAALSANGWLGVVLGLIPVGRQGLQVLGVLPAKYSGVQWPFLYSFGSTPGLSGATARRQRTLGRILDSLSF